MDKRGQAIRYIMAFIIAIIIVFVIIQIFTQKTKESGKQLSELTKETKIDPFKCESFILDRGCTGQCPEDKRVYGDFKDCMNDKPYCCERT